MTPLFFLINFIHLSFSYLTLDIGLTYDDYLNREVVNFTSNGGWNNGDYILENSSITDTKYHGPFDDYTLSVISLLTRQIQVYNFGYVRVNYSLIFGCDILEYTDDVDMQFDNNNKAREYYWINKYAEDYKTNEYPYETADGFTIDEYYDPILLDDAYCTNIHNPIGDEVSWIIRDSYLSPRAYNPGDTFLFGFLGRFDHSSPYEDVGKFWAVTDIVFELIHIKTDHPTMDPTTVPTMHPTVNPTFQTMHPTKIPTFNPSNYPTLSPSNVPTMYPTDVPTITNTTEWSGKGFNSTMNEELFEKEEKKGSYTVLIVMIVIIFVMLIAVLIMHLKKKMDEKELKERGGKIEMRNKHSSESNLNGNANDGLLHNDAVAMNNNGMKNEVMITPMSVGGRLDSDDVDEEYELTSTDNEN